MDDTPTIIQTDDCLSHLLNIMHDIELVESKYGITCTAILDGLVEFVSSCPMAVFTLPDWFVERISK